MCIPLLDGGRGIIIPAKYKLGIFAYDDDSTLLAVVRKPEDRPAVAASLNRDLARIQEWCNHWYMI